MPREWIDIVKREAWPPGAPAVAWSETLHRYGMSAISRLPAGRCFSWRAYNYILLRAGPERYLGRTFFGAEFECNLKDLIQRSIYYFGIWEPEISTYILQKLQSGDVFLDIGANIGYDALLGAFCVGQSGQVIAIEASPDIFEMLKSNITRNNCNNITAICAAVSDTTEKIPLYAGPPNNIGMTTTDATRSLRYNTSLKYAGDFDAAPVESLVSRSLLKRVKLIKIDIEGGETKILNHFLDSVCLYSEDVEILVELAQAATDKEWSEFNALLTRFRSNGFRCYALNDKYDINTYLTPTLMTGPTEITSYPTKQTDVLLSRSVPSS